MPDAKRRTVPARTATESPAAHLRRFMAPYTPEVRRVAREALTAIRRQLPGAVELVYDNYNGVVIGFSPNDRPSEAVLSIALYADHVSLCFLFGVELDDPTGRLRGGGNRVRHMRLPNAAVLDEPDIRALIAAARDNADVPFVKAKRRMIIRSVSLKRRPRRPVNPAAWGRFH